MPHVGLYVPVFKNRMNALARAADTVTDAAGHSGMKNDNFKDGEMRLTVGLALTLAIMTCGAQARDMQSIEHSGELKVGVPGDYAPLAFRNAAGELQGYDVDMAKPIPAVEAVTSATFPDKSIFMFLPSGCGSPIKRSSGDIAGDQ